MFGIFKTVDKQKKLEEELNEFIAKNKDYFNSYCFDGNNFIIYKEPEIRNGKELVLGFIDIDTPNGYINFLPIWLLNLKHGENFMKEHRIRFVKLKDEMEKLGLSVTLKNKNQ